ncbi:hypothetical protein D3C71_980500 [compost metagenome]
MLGAVDHPLTVTQFGAGAQVVRFGTGLGFGQAEAADGLAAGQISQPGLFLLFSAVIEHRPATHRVVDAHERTGGAVAGRDFFHRQRVGNVVDVGAAPFLRHHHAQQAQFTHLRHQTVVDPAGLFPGLGVRRDFTAGKVPGHVADHYLFFSQFEIVHGSAPALIETVEKTRHVFGVQRLQGGRVPAR